MTNRSDLQRRLEPLRRIKAPDDFTTRVVAACALDGHKPRRSRTAAYLRGAALGLAAVLAVMLWTGNLDQPGPADRTAGKAGEIRLARAELAWTLELTAKVLDHGSSQAIYDIFEQRLPDAINRSLMTTLDSNQKGNS